MSLIHDALREQDGPALPVRPAPRASWWARQSPRARGTALFAAAGLGGFVLAGAVLLGLGGRGNSAPPAHAAEAPAPALPATAPVVTLPTTASAPPPPMPDVVHLPAAAPATASAAVPRPAQSPDPAPPAIAVQEPPVADTHAASTAVAAAPVAATPAPARTAPQPMATASEGTAPAIRIEVERRNGAAPADGGRDGRAVEQAVADVERAMAGGDLANARQALARLDGLLAPESLTLLRMQAWVAHAGNDTARAETLYRRIAERVPEDVNAGVNIALLDARRGDADAARTRLVRLSGRHPRSPQVARALAELGSTAP
ncbi:tetratricopeptide repeat protein [Stenotrophomonas acidaminiphila]|uniref:tetratricopeptide repeat protein n=1 Tax=Stenotrophomonas acidaminiphila TaxID=128780 RepID=UPI0024AD3258|nr:tetratricopeptide repeat protein [Stenotrophomonas acidaminiphila]WHL18233.1 hypothetical protein QLF99_14360 [Stenotrophomonas acidaminiphila]